MNVDTFTKILKTLSFILIAVFVSIEFLTTVVLLSVYFLFPDLFA